jgi:hypothetical protein
VSAKAVAAQVHHEAGRGPRVALHEERLLSLLLLLVAGGKLAHEGVGQ